MSKLFATSGRPDVHFGKDAAESVCQADVAGYRPVIRIIFVDNAPDFPPSPRQAELIELMPVAPCDKTAIQEAAAPAEVRPHPSRGKERGTPCSTPSASSPRSFRKRSFSQWRKRLRVCPAIATPKPRLIPVHPANTAGCSA